MGFTVGVVGATVGPKVGSRDGFRVGVVGIVVVGTGVGIRDGFRVGIIVVGTTVGTTVGLVAETTDKNVIRKHVTDGKQVIECAKIKTFAHLDKAKSSLLLILYNGINEDQIDVRTQSLAE